MSEAPLYGGTTGAGVKPTCTDKSNFMVKSVQVMAAMAKIPRDAEDRVPR